MSEATLNLSDPTILRALRDVPTMQRWEILRRSARAMSVTDIASAASATTIETQRSLDALVDARLAIRQPATARRRQSTYRAAMGRLYLTWNRNDPADAAAWRALGQLMREHSRRVLDDALRRSEREQLEPHNFGACMSVMLLDDDAKRVRDSLRAVHAMLGDADRRARASAEPGAAKPYHVTTTQQRLPKAEPPMADFLVLEQSIHREERRLLDSARTLSPRELEVARLLERGLSRPRVAEKLGLKANTIASISKAVYRKLGVNSRAQLAERMRMV